MSRVRSGAVLLEVIVALTILTVAGSVVVTLSSESTRAIERSREADRAMREASAFLDAVALWPREDLDRRLGDHAQGPWRLRIERPLTTLYTIALADSGGKAELLRTSLFRPVPPRAAP